MLNNITIDVEAYLFFRWKTSWLSIHDKDETYLAKTLKLYHGGDRTNPAMQAMSFLMAESDITKLAAYYARQPAK